MSSDDAYERLDQSIEKEYEGLDKDQTIARLKREVVRLRDSSSNLYATNLTCYKNFAQGHGHIPQHGSAASHCKEILEQIHQLDNRPRLNTSSYVNVVFEDEEKDIAIQGLTINIADGSVYPASVKLHDSVVDSIANLWNCPKPATQGEDSEHFSGAGTVGSTEACLLALLAHKFRWRKWYAAKHGLTPDEVIGVIPNMVIPTHYQACWEKAFRYFDIKPKFLYPEFKKFRIDPEDMRNAVDDKTIMVVGVLGNHYNGTYDPIWEMDKILTEINEEKGLQVGLHVDAASGGFIAPFQSDLPAWDFRLKNVLTISASGHKFGESSCGTGWVVFRHRHDLSEHIEVEVTYLGGISYSMTLNFSRPATGIYVQAYKFLRMGMQGYKQKVQNQLDVTSHFREKMRALKWTSGEPMFEISDADDEPGLPVVSCRVNPKLGLAPHIDDFSIQNAVGEFHWYIGAYRLSFEDFTKGGEAAPLCKDEPIDASMFRVVFKSNLSKRLADDLFTHLLEIIDHWKEDDSASAAEDDEDQGTNAFAAMKFPSVPDAPSVRSARAPFKKAYSIREAIELKKGSTRGGRPFTNRQSAC